MIPSQEKRILFYARSRPKSNPQGKRTRYESPTLLSRQKRLTSSLLCPISETKAARLSPNRLQEVNSLTLMTRPIGRECKPDYSSLPVAEHFSYLLAFAFDSRPGTALWLGIASTYLSPFSMSRSRTGGESKRTARTRLPLRLSLIL